MDKQKIRTIITQDAEVDDQNSLRHFLFYANEVDLQGIVQTSSKFHWIGVPGAVRPEKKYKDDFDGDIPEENGDFDKPYRWTGTDWMFRAIDDYEKDYPNLIRHSDGYPAPDYLRYITKIGNIGYEGETEQSSEGSDLIKARILDDDPRPLYIQIWGGVNTVARALMDIQKEYEGTCAWEAMHRMISDKVILTACGEQDQCYREYVAEVWPEIQFVKLFQLFSYAYPWLGMPECESKDTLKADFMKREILNGKSALADGYCTWLDGKYYEGEPDDAQFGANPDMAKDWFGVKVMGMPEPEKYAFLSEGDSPTFFPLLDWGLRSTENFAYGGFGGRCYKKDDEFNSKGEPLNYWDECKDYFADRDGSVSEQESMWPFVADIQRDFAARVGWAGADSYEKGEHKPSLRVAEGVDIKAVPGETVELHAETSSPDGDEVTVSFRIYEEASAVYACRVAFTQDKNSASIAVPTEAEPGDQIHVIVKAQSEGHHRLAYYQQVIITIE